MTRLEIVLRLSLSSVLLVLAILYTIEATTFTPLARYAPETAGTAASVLLALVVVRELIRLIRYDPDRPAAYGRTIEYMEDSEGDVTPAILRASLKYTGWIVGFVVLIWLLGLIVAAPLFLALFLLIDARSSIRFTAISIVGVLVCLWLLGQLGFTWPPGVFLNV